MEKYRLEASSKSLKGRVICGAGSGYTASNVFSLEQVLDFLDEINLDFEERKIKTIPCFVKEGVIVGRASTSKYRAKTYDFEFSWSPRIGPIKSIDFYKSLVEYAKQLGDKLGQVRVYVEFGGKTTIFKSK